LNNKQHYLLLDAFRGIAAIIVMIYHIKTYVIPDIQHPFGVQFLRHSYLAVDLFFLMSGLVIARAYEGKLVAKTMSVISFCAVRLIRLWPLYIVGTLFGFIYAVIRPHITEAEPFIIQDHLLPLLVNLFFIPDLGDPKNIFPFDPAAWSLSLEMGINIVYAIFAVRLSNKVLGFITLLSGCAFAVACIMYGSSDMGWGKTTFTEGILRILFSFSLGILLFRLTPPIKFVLSGKGTPILLLALAVLLLTPWGSPNVWYDLTCIFVAFPGVIVLGKNAIVSGRLSAIYTFLGRVSYPVYILHSVLVMWLAGAYKMMLHKDPDMDPYLSGSFLIVGIILISYLVCILYDEPLRKFLSARYQRSKP
jgi:peptidoglycan/LPS O-acetylase OafA/YrhL